MIGIVAGMWTLLGYLLEALDRLREQGRPPGLTFLGGLVCMVVGFDLAVLLDALGLVDLPSLNALDDLVRALP